MAVFELDDLYLPMVRNGRARMTDDLADLRAEHPAWDFDVSWITVSSGPDMRKLFAWNRDTGEDLTAFDADEMRRKIREARG